MAAKTLGLFFLLLWTSGLVQSIYIPAVNEWDEKIVHPWHISPHLRRRFMRYGDRFPNLLNGNNFLPNLESRTSRLHFQQPDTEFDKSIFQKDRKEAGFIRNVPNLSSIENSVLNYLGSSEQISFPSPVANKVKGSKYPKLDFTARKSEYLYLTKVLPENNIMSTTGSHSLTPLKSSVLHLEPRDNHAVTGKEIASESGRSTTQSRNDLDSVNSQGTTETDGVSTLNDLTSGPEINPVSTENSTAIDVTEELQNETDNSLKNNSDSSTTENTTGKVASEITSSIDSREITSEDTLYTGTTSASTADGNTESSYVNTDNSVSHMSITPTTIQTEESTPPSTSYSTDGDEILSTTNQVTAASETESTVTSYPSSSTDETKGIRSTTMDFTKSEFISTTVDFTEFSTRGEKEITEPVPQDHVIKIKSIKTARVIVSVVFIVIALVAVVVIAVYIFRAKRRAAQYDELMLLP